MKDKIINMLKIFLLVFPATLGWHFLCLFIWFLLDLPAEWWATVLLTALSCGIEFAVIRWIGRVDNA